MLEIIVRNKFIDPPKLWRGFSTDFFVVHDIFYLNVERVPNPADFWCILLVLITNHTASRGSRFFFNLERLQNHTYFALFLILSFRIVVYEMITYFFNVFSNECDRILKFVSSIWNAFQILKPNDIINYFQ